MFGFFFFLFIQIERKSYQCLISSRNPCNAQKAGHTGLRVLRNRCQLVPGSVKWDLSLANGFCSPLMCGSLAAGLCSGPKFNWCSTSGTEQEARSLSSNGSSVNSSGDRLANRKLGIAFLFRFRPFRLLIFRTVTTLASFTVSKYEHNFISNEWK